MKVSAEKPPNYERIKSQFGDRWDTGLIVTYGDTSYCKKGGMPPDLHVHEETHQKQQTEMGVERWWERYYQDKDFRLSQELEAYKNQARYIKQFVSNRRKREEKLEFICTSMAEMYDGMVSYEEARKHIL